MQRSCLYYSTNAGDRGRVRNFIRGFAVRYYIKLWQGTVLCNRRATKKRPPSAVDGGRFWFRLLYRRFSFLSWTFSCPSFYLFSFRLCLSYLSFCCRLFWLFSLSFLSSRPCLFYRTLLFCLSWIFSYPSFCLFSLLSHFFFFLFIPPPPSTPFFPSTIFFLSA